MPADFLLSSVNTAPSNKAASEPSDLFHKNQPDSSEARSSFRNELEREVRRNASVQERERRDPATDDRRSDTRRDDSLAANSRPEADKSGKSLPDRQSGQDTAVNEKSRSDNTAHGDNSSRATQTSAGDGVQQGSNTTAASADDAAMLPTSQQHAPQEQLPLEQRRARVAEQLTEYQQQALVSLRQMLGELRLEKGDAATERLMAQLQQLATELGIDSKALARKLNQLLESAEVDGSKGIHAMVQALAGEDGAALGEVLSGLKDVLSRDEQPVAADDLPVDTGDLPEEIIAGSVADDKPGTDLSALLAGTGFILNPGVEARSDTALASAAPWGLTRLQGGQGFAAKGTLTDRLNGLVQGNGDSSDDKADKESAKAGLARDIDFLVKNADKLSAKSRDALGDLSLLDLANQAKQLMKQPDSPLQQKLTEAVAQIKAAIADTAKAETAAVESSSARNSPSNAQPLPAFMRTLEQINAPQPMQKAQMTMQNHFSKPGWSNELGQRLMMMVGSKIQVAEIRLDPPDLGPMEVKVRMQQEQAHVVFQSQHAAVRDALEQAVPRLRELFDQNGVGLGNVDVQDQTAQQRQGEDQEGAGQLAASGEGLDGDADVTDTEQVTVTASDRLVDYYA